MHKSSGFLFRIQSNAFLLNFKSNDQLYKKVTATQLALYCGYFDHSYEISHISYHDCGRQRIQGNHTKICQLWNLRGWTVNNRREKHRIASKTCIRLW